MKRTLYEIGENMIALVGLLMETGGDVTDQEAENAIDQWLAETQSDLENKADSICCLIREFEARAEAREQEAKRLLALAATDTNQAKRLKERLKRFFDQHEIKKLETDRFKLWIQANGGAVPLIIPDQWEREPASAPEAFQRRVIQLDKEAIREAIRNDEEAFGAALGERGHQLRMK
jgi:hypothetical protein